MGGCIKCKDTTSLPSIDSNRDPESVTRLPGRLVVFPLLLISVKVGKNKIVIATTIF